MKGTQFEWSDGSWTDTWSEIFDTLSEVNFPVNLIIPNWQSILFYAENAMEILFGFWQVKNVLLTIYSITKNCLIVKMFYRRLDGTLLEVKTQEKYLGIILDRK